MGPQFARRLQALRHNKMLTQSELAQRSGLARRTICNWEGGNSLPRTPELEAALQVLEALPAEYTLLTGLLDRLRIRRSAEKESVANPADAFPGVEVEDLLRALRMRHHMTQAAKLGINRQSVLRWEGGHHRISDAHLERLCCLLGASPVERLTLR